LSKKRDAAPQGMIEALEDQADADAVRVFRDRLASGEEELIPEEFVRRLVDGETTVKVWREFRSFTTEELAEKAGVSMSELLAIESGERAGSLETVKKIAAALNLTVDDLA